MLKSRLLVGLDWAKPMMFLLLYVTCSYIFHAYVPLFSIFFILNLFGTLLLVSLSLSLSLSRLVCAWHLNASLLCPGTLFVPGQHLVLILLLLLSGSMMINPIKTFQRTFLDPTFIQNAKSLFRTFPILTFPLSFTVGVGSLYMTTRSLVPLWSYRSSTPICTTLITLYLFSSLICEVRAL